LVVRRVSDAAKKFYGTDATRRLLAAAEVSSFFSCLFNNQLRRIDLFFVPTFSQTRSKFLVDGISSWRQDACVFRGITLATESLLKGKYQ
jgi:hypothetical protein